MHVAQCPTTEARRGLARDVVARGLRHEPNMFRATNVARTAKRWFQRRASPGRNETVSAHGWASTQHTHAIRPAARPRRDCYHAQDGLEFNPPVFLDVRKACAGKKVLIMGLPGAFTPC